LVLPGLFVCFACFWFVFRFQGWPERPQTSSSSRACWRLRASSLLHEGGHGAPLILLYGYAETSRMWTPILPVLGEKSTVIALDLPGSESLPFLPMVWT